MSEAAPAERLIPLYSREDETHLLWYFGLGQTAFERSTSGGMLDRAAQFANSDAWPRVQVLNAAGACIGWESAITARPTAETRSISGYVPDEFAMTRYADVSRLMMKVERRDGLSATVIGLLFGDAGQRWATGEHGRLGALYHITTKGRLLIEAADKLPGAVPLTAEQRIESICLVNKAQPKPERTIALAVCAREANKLEKRAREVWHLVKST